MRTMPVSAKMGAISKAERDRRSKIEAEYKGNRPISQEPPESLTEDGKAIYTQILANLPLDQLSETDGYSVEVVADAIDKMRRCRAEIAERGLFVEVTDKQGRVIRDQNKAVLVYTKYSDILKKYIAELGLSPVARSRIASLAKDEGKEKKISPLMALLAEDDEDEDE